MPFVPTDQIAGAPAPRRRAGSEPPLCPAARGLTQEALNEEWNRVSAELTEAWEDHDALRVGQKRAERAWVEMQLRDLRPKFDNLWSRYDFWMRDDLAQARMVVGGARFEKLLKPYPPLAGVLLLPGRAVGWIG